MRRNVYPKRVSAGKMSQEDADREIQTMDAVYETLKALDSWWSALDVYAKVEAADAGNGSVMLRNAEATIARVGAELKSASGVTR